MDGRRRRSRIKGHFQGFLECEGEKVDLTTDDLSLKGLSAELSQPVAEEKECKVTIPLGKDVTVSVRGVVVRSEGNTAAIDFKQLDEESYLHLRNMVRLSADDPDIIDEELKKPAFGEPPTS